MIGMPELAEWDSFYLIVGGAAGALIGLQFVVMTLIAERPQVQRSEVGSTFATPTIIHFGAVLFVAAVLRLPFKTAGQLALVLGVIGVLGVLYMCRVTWRMKSQDIYEPVFEDWLTHSVLPFAAYATLAIAAFYLTSALIASLFAVGAASLLLLFTGIHNAWDATTYNVFTIPKIEAAAEEPDEKSG